MLHPWVSISASRGAGAPDLLPVADTLLQPEIELVAMEEPADANGQEHAG